MTRITPHRASYAAVAAAVLVATAAITAPVLADEDADPLQVLLTNDDGYTSPGLTAVRDALCEAGHEVTVVAPSSGWSGSGAKVSIHGEFDVTRESFACGDGTGEGLSVDGASPADTVYFASQVVFDGEAPDLVVSGVNRGQNTAFAANHSGTVGATIAAINRGVPAIAASLELGPSAEMAAAYPDAATTVADLVDQLQRTQRDDEALLTPGTALSLNYPMALDAEGHHDPALVKEPTLTEIGTSEWLQIAYTETEPGHYVLEPSLCAFGSPECPETRRDSDAEALADDHVTVTMLDGDWTAPQKDQARINSRLAGLDH